MFAVLRRISTAILALLALAPFAGAYQQTRAVSSTSDVHIEVDEPFVSLPPSGFFPVHIKVSNRSREDHVWRIDFSSRGLGPDGDWRHREEFAAAAGQDREFDFLIPQDGLFSTDFAYAAERLQFSGFGLEKNAGVDLSSDFRGNRKSAFILMSDTLANESWSRVSSFVGGRSTSYTDLFRRSRMSWTKAKRSLNGSMVKLSELPPDPRAFSGAAGLWLSVDDWRTLEAPLRNAIGQWVTDGGNLFVASAAPTVPLAGLPSFDAFDKAAPVGFGSVRVVPLDGRSLDARVAADDILDLDGSPLPRWKEDFNSWLLFDRVGAPYFNVPAIIIFVVAFAAAIGPINLLWLASQRRRHRLFFTIPLLSIASCVALSLCILLGDGLGANGRRNTLVLMSAGENRLSIVQEQVCRTHFLFDPHFPIAENASLAQIAPKRGDHILERSGAMAAGDWFRSREITAQFIQASAPARAAVTLEAAPDGAPSLLSSAATAFPEVFFVDGAGQYWHGVNLTPGRPLKLETSSASAYQTWLGVLSEEFSGELHQLLVSVAGRNGYFYALADVFPEAPVATLRSIRWDNQTIVCFGSCTAANVR